jgi:cellulose synthase/poly-beta-1,6-N-acetylglucosamine synthase-like glycosyltransferase
MAQTFVPQAIDRLEVAIGSKKLGEIFLELGYLTPANLGRALEYQQAKGGRLGWILATLGYINRLELFEGLARHMGLPFEAEMDVLREEIDKKTAQLLTHEEMVRYQAVPFSLKKHVMILLTSEPDNQPALDLIRKRSGATRINQVVVTDLDIMKLSEGLYRESILDTSINGLLNRNPAESAYKVFTTAQITAGVVMVCLLGIWLLNSHESFILTMLYGVQLFYAVPILFKLMLVIFGKLKHPGPDAVELNRRYSDRDLPIYTILIAAYKEKEVIGNLIRSIKKLDYPEDKLDIILLLEEKDNETLDAAKAEKPPANWRFLVLPDSLPRTKPKALNYGLSFARGEFLTIYDAEDMPEPDQLKKSVAAFRTHPNNYICFQAALNYFNKNENFLTKMFTLEYSSWFDCLLPGLFRAGLPIPLGGTSNHFDTAKLRKIGAWDPFNVTEDADLGIRASVEGYKVGVIDSTTYEEANSRLPNWIRQRSRWVKGYMQTFLVYNRNPFHSLKALGLKRWASYTLLVGGTPANFLLSPIMWLLYGFSLLVNTTAWFHVPASLIWLSGANLIAGNIIVISIAMIGAIPRKNYNLVLMAVLSPIYWMLQSFAAYKGLWQLLTKPHYWEKTTHGITKSVPVSQTLTIPEDASELVVVRNGRNL